MQQLLKKPKSKITCIAVNPLILLPARKQFGVCGVWNGILLWQYLLERIGHQCLAGRLHSPHCAPHVNVLLCGGTLYVPLQGNIIALGYGFWCNE